ncbi:hypothetical protein D3C80_1277110 [compost metagenome]
MFTDAISADGNGSMQYYIIPEVAYGAGPFHILGEFPNPGETQDFWNLCIGM